MSKKQQFKYQQKFKPQPSKMQAKFSVVTNPAIHNIVDDLVKTRCSIDINHSGPARHISAILGEKSQSCFKTDDDWYQSRELYAEEEKPYIRHTIQQPSEEEEDEYALYPQVYTCGRDGLG